MINRELDLLLELEKLDKDEKFRIFYMDDLDLEALESEKIDFQGGKFKENAEYYYSFDGYIVSLESGHLMDFLISSLEEVTDGEFLLEEFDR